MRIQSTDSAAVDAMRATWELLSKLRVDAAFVGPAAISAWLDRPVDFPSIEILALMSPDRGHQIPMMAANRGFDVDRDAVEAARELDLIPLGFGNVRIHVLLASNALYAKMIAAAVDADLNGTAVRVVSAEDLALLLLVGESEESATLLRELRERPNVQFDTDGFNQKLASIGLASKRLQ